MDEKKQTVGRAKELKEIEKIVRTVLENRTDIKYIPNLALPIADELSKHYQPKIPKGSVVLTKEEYELLKIKKNKKYWLEGCLSVWKRVEVETRKKTAREILCEFKKHGAKGYEYFIEFLAKEYGVEVE